ncbi:glycerol-3-phosphate dehydrogenase (NAD(P)+) [Thermosporothrix hazakensis]|uniref:Glycerol-3-phosphate dehydrogenase [NAD(P)+] n=2 Tax=Thermosporothrix TaxID=768650 RepID=A0A326U070_THEHA|nr:NAD(P)H-dependent glycerol-3-phosphate dehydrogenase [Thermosporothrix hazakensis]PZW23437.1 glycerol-3-phosphate dehydrogenase (NAD(P)+) [Thermosporothrix hazakensis]BBH89783.1 glycerol-3-phosphate dehydrogenase [NAD(P)+] [Thermosporothrix sp. COM3]GCE47972.1 glycerol-3-phosphate dehydrogenase [NAD(P)+] [Thermosporothrix hazakensis]
MVAIGVIGCGAWGTTLARLLAKKGLATTLWEHRPERASVMQQRRENTLFLPGFPFPDTLQVTSNIAEAVSQKDLVLLVTPSQRMRENLRLLKPYLEAQTLLLSASKGIEIGTLKRMTEVVAEEIPDAAQRLAALSGPNLSQEVAQEKPTAAVVAAVEPAVAITCRDLLSTAYFRVYSSDDVVGVELGGALKNIIAIGAGMNDGLGYGENAKATFITRGLAEIARLGIAAGANPLTFSGLAGIGDLIATCASPLSRNQQLGRRLAAGERLADILQSTHSVAEGVTTTKAALQLAKRYHVELPITEQLSHVLFDNQDPHQAVAELMLRDPKGELEGII